MKDLVVIEWKDSHGGRGWQDIDRIKAKTSVLKCLSVGWIAKRGRHCIMLVPHLAGDNQDIIGQGCGDLCIPTCAIKKIHRVKFGRR